MKEERFGSYNIKKVSSKKGLSGCMNMIFHNGHHSTNLTPVPLHDYFHLTKIWVNRCCALKLNATYLSLHQLFFLHHGMEK